MIELSRRPFRRSRAVVLAAGLAAAVTVTGCVPSADAVRTVAPSTGATSAAAPAATSPTPATAQRTVTTGRRPESSVTQSTTSASAPATRRPGQLVKTTLVSAVAALPVRTERRTGYDRDLFAHWSDADGNGCDTREEILISQNRAPGAKLGAGCRVVGGEWFSYYDQTTTRNSSTFDVDHLVPLAEAWDSGAHRWGPARREAFANDLGDRRALIAVSASSNRTKSDADPATWMPAYKACVYISSWVAIKTRWQLSVDTVEKATLTRYADRCGSRRTTVRVAHVVGASTGDARPSDATRMPAHTGPAPAPGPSQPPAGGSGTDPRFPYCTDAIAAGYGPYVRGTDPEYDWYRDGDSDGVVCET